MRTSLSSARDKKTDFHPRTGGNRYKVIKEQQAVPDMKDGNNDTNAGIDIEKEVQATKKQGQDGERSQIKSKTGFNTDFLLARALQTTVQNIDKAA